jgi:hypothetical protein
MSTTPHAAAHSPRQARKPYATGDQHRTPFSPFTDKQLTELISLRSKISQQDMQAFLRPGTKIRKTSPVAQAYNPNGQLLKEIQSNAQEHLPFLTDQIMEIVELLCDHHNSLEFLPPITTGGAGNDKPDHVMTAASIHQSLIWLDRPNVQVVEMLAGYQVCKPGERGYSLKKVVRNRMFADVIAELRRSSPELVQRAKHVADRDARIIVKLLAEKLALTGAFRYGLLEHRELNAIACSAVDALFPAVLLLAKEDNRYITCVNFIKTQLGGRPIVEYVTSTNTVYQLVAPVTKPYFVEY